jgi:hypothetical protein
LLRGGNNTTSNITCTARVEAKQKRIVPNILLRRFPVLIRRV